MKIYVNGALETTGTGATGTKSTPSTLHLGNIQTNSNYFNGAMDQVRIYDTVLTASEVSALAAEGTTRTILASAEAGGSISPSGSVSVDYGTSQTFTVTPNPGYAVAGLNIDGVSVTPTTSYTFNNVTEDHSITASFGKPYGVSNKTALNDAKIGGKPVRVWGRVTSVTGTVSFTISDGYSTPVTVDVNGTTMPSGIEVGRMVVVNGMLDAEKCVHAQTITLYP